MYPSLFPNVHLTNLLNIWRSNPFSMSFSRCTVQGCSRRTYDLICEDCVAFGKLVTPPGVWMSRYAKSSTLAPTPSSFKFFLRTSAKSFSTIYTSCAEPTGSLFCSSKSNTTRFCTFYKMGKGRRKQKRHIRRGFTRDQIGIHRNHFNPASIGVRVRDGQIMVL